MKSRKILAAVLAPVCALSATAVVANAVALNLTSSPAEGEADVISLASYATDVDLSKVVKVEVGLSVNSGYCNGCIGASDANGDWISTGQVETSSTASDTWTLNCPDGLSGGLELQIWYVGYIYDADGNATDEKGTVSIKALRLLDAEGNDLTVAGGSQGGGGENNGGEEENKPNVPAGGTVLTSASTTLPSDWSKAVQITSDLLKNAKPGDTLMLTLSKGSGTPQLQFKDGSWETLPGNSSNPNSSPWWDGFDLEAGATSFIYTLTKEDIAIIKSTGTLIIGGCNITIDSVIFYNTGKDDDSSSSSDGGIIIVPVPSTNNSGNDGNTATDAPSVSDQVIKGEADVKPGTDATVKTDAGDITVTTAEDDTALEGTAFVVDTVKDTDKGLTEAVGANATAQTKEIVTAAEKAVDNGDAVVLDLSFEKDGGKVQPGKPVTVKMPVPAALKGASKIFVYHVSESGITLVASPDVKDGAISFTANAFSPYIFSKVELKAAGENSGSTAAPGNTGNPNTGIGYALAPVIVCAAAAMVATSKKRK